MIVFATQDPALVPFLVSALHVTIGLLASGHVLLRKRDTRAAIGWIGLIWLSPFLGTLIYVMFGVNRINRKARSLRRPSAVPFRGRDLATARLSPEVPPQPAYVPGIGPLEDLAAVVGRLTGWPLLAGNAIEPLVDGDQAYPAMIEAIDRAARSVALSTYIFNNDRAGALFVEALRRAVERGVAVRVLVDDVGARYHLPTVFGPLRRAGVTAATFMPTLTPGWARYSNLRNHRKLLVVDGRLGFTGGLNIDESYLHRVHPHRPKHDTHFRIEGPVVAHLQQAFAEDWEFATGEALQGEAWFPPLGAAPSGCVLARGITDGPDEDDGKLLMTILGALSCARKTVRLVTPYFIPEVPLLSALNVAALRGVEIDIILPRENNLLLVQWASTALLPQVLEAGCRVWYSPPPFDHTKLLIVDSAWTLIGSGNCDPRSLRLNFEFNVECHSPALARSLEQATLRRIECSRPVTLADLDRRPLPIKLRDGIARLMSPYL
ncbi:MAG: PLDc N-terminal domain-containing protein [Isosphaeraceae bacterium]|nr:PLDc N-terminal domain-containing protein [Isosphaeraceae bacterium]